VRKSVDAQSYTIRFTPRKPDSYWSAVNTRRAEALIAAGRMAPPGLAAFRRRDAKRTREYSFERAAAALRPDEEKRFRAAGAAWAFFEKQPPGYRKVAAWFVASAKKDETRRRRLDRLIATSAAGRRLV
jgi:uncharacterized protein YdeI (YjbR/CyaY-like superfamily)